MEAKETTVYAENSGAIVNDSTIQAEQVAGRDIYNYYSEDPTFTSVDLEYYGSEEYLSPNITASAMEQLIRQRILLIHGGPAFDKGGFIRHLALKVQSKTTYKVQELELNEENDSLYRQIGKSPSKSIYLLDRLHPQHVDYDLPRLQSLTEPKSIFIIITTDLSLDIWQINEAKEASFCLQIPEKKLYSDSQLTGYLKRKLVQKWGSWKRAEANGQAAGEKIFGVSVKEIASKLASPENLRLFVLRLQDQRSPSKESVHQLVTALLESDEGIVRKWFMSLANKQKLIALGAALLEGTYDDQYFSMMSHITEKMWKHSEESLKALDYHDLDFLSDFFRFESLGYGRYLLQSKYPLQSADIIRCSWNSHRRHLLSTLSVFSTAARESLNTQSTDWENFGTMQRRANLRLVVGKAISEFGLVSTFSVENTLIEFAAHPEDRIKRIAAKSVARWREVGEDEKLFSLLRSWLEDERPRKIISEYLSKRQGQHKNQAYQEKALSYLKVSVIHALSYSANYDSPNKLHRNIIVMVTQLIEDQDSLIVNTLQWAIPRLVHHHVLQLKDVILDKFMKHDHMIEPVATGLARAFKDYPEDLKATLDRWFEECLRKNSQSNRRKKLTYRDQVLVTILEFYAHLEFDDTNQAISLDQVYEKLLKLTRSEQRRQVRDAIFKTVAQLIKWDWKKFEEKTPGLLKQLDLKDARHLVSELVDIFLQERKQLTGTGYTFVWKEKTYPLWPHPNDRPKTSLEKRLMHWIEAEQVILKQVATLSFLKIAEQFELEELDRMCELEQRLLEQKLYRPSVAQAPRQRVNYDRVSHDISLFTQIRIFFLLLFEPRASKQTLKSLLIALYQYRRYNRAYKQHLVLVFRKWRASQYPFLRKLTRWLRKLI